MKKARIINVVMSVLSCVLCAICLVLYCIDGNALLAGLWGISTGCWFCSSVMKIAELCIESKKVSTQLNLGE